MPDAPVKMKFFADAAAAERAIVQLEKKYDTLERKITEVSRRSKKGTEDGIAGLIKQQFTAEKTANAINILANNFVGLTRFQSEYRQEVERSAIALDEVIRKFRIQQGLTGLSGEAARNLASKIGTEAGVSQESVLRIGKELISTGFQDPLQSGAAKSVIAFLQASAQDVDSAPLEEIVSAFAQQLTASGQTKNARNLLNIGVQTRALFEKQELQAPDLIEFARVRGLATALGINQEEFLSAATVLRGAQQAPQAATGFANFLAKLSAPKGRETKALNELGLAATDVDLVGENLQTVLSRLSGAVQALPAERRSPALAGLFGAEATNQQAARALIDAAGGKFQSTLANTRDTGGFAFAVNEARGGVGSANRRLEAQIALEESKLQDAIIASGGIPETTLQLASRLESVRVRRKLTERGNNFGLLLTDAAEGTQRKLGLPDTFGAGPQAFGAARQALDRGGDFSLDDLVRELKTNNEAMQEQNRLMQQDQGRRPAVDRQANIER